MPKPKEVSQPDIEEIAIEQKEETKQPEDVVTPEQANEYLEGWKRARAELVNYRAQVVAQQARAQASLTKAVLQTLFPLADNFQSMITHTPPELQVHNWVQGVTQIAKQLDTIFAGLGVERMNLGEEEFDPSRHEAVAEVALEGVTAGTIVEVLQAGYMLGEHVLRPARVKVAK